MMKLNTIIKQNDDNSAYVAWWTGQSKYGVILVKCDPIIDVKIQSELLAIKYLLFIKRVFNRDIVGGNGYQLNVSSGAIKKLVNKKSTKKELIPYARFLNVEMAGVNINIVKSHPNLPEPLIGLDFSSIDDSEFEVISSDIDESNAIENSTIKTKFGDVILTKHALEQYKKRNIFGEAKNPVKSLITQLQHTELQQFDITPFSNFLKKLKYKTSDTEIWGHPSSLLKFIVVKNNHSDQKVLVTVYLKKLNNYL